MSVSAVFYQLVCHIKGCIKIFSLIKSQDRRKFLMGKRLGDIYRSNLADQDLCVLRNRYSSQFGDNGSRLSYDLGIYGAGFSKDDLADFIQFFII